MTFATTQSKENLRRLEFLGEYHAYLLLELRESNECIPVRFFVPNWVHSPYLGVSLDFFLTLPRIPSSAGGSEIQRNDRMGAVQLEQA